MRAGRASRGERRTPAAGIARVVGIAGVVGCLVLTGCARSTSTSPSSADELAAIRAGVSALSTPAGWVRDGGVRYDCDVVNLDCMSTSSGLWFTTTASDACASLVAWVTSTPAFVSPVNLQGLTTWTAPEAATCTSELAARGRYRIKAGSTVATSSAAAGGSSTATWELLVTPDQGGATMSVVLGNPPGPLPSRTG